MSSEFPYILSSLVYIAKQRLVHYLTPEKNITYFLILGEQEWIYRKFWREENGERNDVIILYLKNNLLYKKLPFKRNTASITRHSCHEFNFLFKSSISMVKHWHITYPPLQTRQDTWLSPHKLSCCSLGSSFLLRYIFAKASLSLSVCGAVRVAGNHIHYSFSPSNFSSKLNKPRWHHCPLNIILLGFWQLLWFPW